MLFKREGRIPLFKTLAFAALLTTTMSCGLLGAKNVPEAKSNVGTTGCLNDSKNLVSRYVAGDMSQPQWKSAFDCIDQSLDFFTEYVRGSSQDSYTQNDMYTLISKFLITNRPVHPELMRGAFSLKSALFGGNSLEFKKDEIALLKSSLSRLRDITADLIPYLALRKQQNPTYEQLNDMVAAFKRAGDQLADFINTLPTEMLSDKAVETLVNELVVSLDLPVIDDLSSVVFSVKWVLFNSRRDAIETTDWPLVFKTAMGMGGILLAYKTSVGTDLNDPRHQVMDRVKNDYHFREFLWDLGQQAKPYLTDMVARHGGAIPFPLFDHLIDELPADMLDNIPKEYLKETLRPMMRKFLISSTKIGVDQGVIDTTYSLLEETVKDLGLLDRFYEKMELDTNDVKPTRFSQALETYYGSLSGNDKVRFAIIKQKLMTYKPEIYRDSGRIRYEPNMGYSKLQGFIVLAVDRVGRHLAKTYGSGADYFVDDDLLAFFAEYKNILFALKIVDPTVSRFGAKRRQDMDLFTPVGDGNGQASVPELVDYAMTIVSASALSAEMRDKIAGNPATGITGKCQSTGIDLMGWERIPADCFRREFNDRLLDWTSAFPRFQKYWSTLSATDRARAMVWLEHGARRNGYTSIEFDKFDFSAMATVLHYTENLFTRFDFDQSEVLGKSEIKDAYPIFKSLLAKKAKISASNDYMLRGIFTYIVKYREMPETSGIGNIAKLGWWLAIYALPTTNYSADRVGVFNIVCQLAAPENTPADDVAALNKTICSQ